MTRKGTGHAAAAGRQRGRRGHYFDTNRAIRETFSAAGYPAPEQLVMVRGGAAPAAVATPMA